MPHSRDTHPLTVFTSPRVLLVGLMFSCLACERDGSSNLETIDAYSTGVEPLELRCEAPPTVKELFLGDVTTFPDDFEESAAQAILRTLASLPAGVQKFFKGDLRGEIVVTSDLKSLCPNSAADGKTPICYVILKDKEDQHRVKIGITNDRDKAQREIPKMFALLVSEVFPKYAEPNPFPPLLESVAKTYALDLIQSGYFTKEETNAILGANAAETLQTKIDAGQNDYLTGISFGPASSGSRTKETSEAFQAAVFRAVFDSYYCNSHAAFDLFGLRSLKGQPAAQRNIAFALTANTRELMRELYPATTKMFDEIHKILEALPAKDSPDVQAKGEAEDPKEDSSPPTEAKSTSKDSASQKDDSEEALLTEVCSLFEFVEGCEEE